MKLVPTEATAWKNAMDECNQVNFEVFSRSTEDLIVVLSPMRLALEKLPHYNSAEFANTSRLLINPGNGNYYRDNVAEIRNLISSTLEETGATRLVFCGSSMGAYGAVYFGSLFPQTKYIVAYAPFIRLDHPGTLSQRSVAPELLVDEDCHAFELLDRLKRSQAEIFLFYPCINGQDGVKIDESRQLDQCEHVKKFFLMCEHDIHRYVSLPMIVAELMQCGTICVEKLQPLLASEEEKEFSSKTYQLFLNQLQGKPLAFELPMMPIEKTVNWQYFYWKARTLARQGERWPSLSNFMAALSYGGDKFSEVHFCVANVLKDLGQINAAIGHYKEAFKLDPENKAIAVNICNLSTV